MSFEAESQADILQRLKTDYRENAEVDVSLIEGTFSGDLLSANAVEFEKAYSEIDLMMDASFATTAWGKYLTMRAAEAGVIRKEATKAIGTLTVTGTGIINAGAQFATESGITFEAVSTVSINKTGEIPIQATEAGEKGNVGIGEINTILISIAGISSVSNKQPTHDGYDEETDESLRERYLLHVRTPGTSGNKTHYMEWATSVSGVGNAKVIPTWQGPGTVKVIIVDSNYEIASEELVQKVADYIETVRPIGAMVTVVGATPKSINIAADIVGDIDETAFRAAVQEYFKEIEKKSIRGNTGEYVAIAKIGSLIIEEGRAEDYTELSLNGMNGNVDLADDEIAVLGEVNFT